jgi:D-alanine transaminase
MALAKDNGISTREAFIPLEQLREAEEVWLASSTREVYAVTELDGRKLGSGEPGPLWRRMFDLFQRHKAELASARP